MKDSAVYSIKYDLGNLLEMLRSRANLTQEELGRLVSVSGNTIRKWENGGSSPKANNLKKLIEVYLQQNVFTPGKEQTEAEKLWTAAALNAAFDEAWFKGLNLAEKSELLAKPVQSQPAFSPRLWQNLPQRSYSRFVGRQAEFQKLLQLMLPSPRSRHFLVTIDGIGGVGKSALVLELAYYYRDNYEKLPPTERFEAIIWVSAKRTLLTARGIQARPQTFNNLDDLYREIATVLESPAIIQSEPAQRRGLVERALTYQRTLLIIDNLETVDDEELLTFLRELPEPTKAIVTTRHRLDIAYPLRLSGMSHEDALTLMELEAFNKHVELSNAAVDALEERTAGLPLAIVWSIGLMSLGYEADSVVRRLTSGQSDIAQFCFAECVVSIRNHKAYRLLLSLALFDSSVSREMLGEVAGLGQDEMGRDDGLAELLQLSLVNKQHNRFSLLPLTRTFALQELNSQPDLEAILRENWFKVLHELARHYTGPDWRWHNLTQVQQEGRHLVTLANWAEQMERPEIGRQIFSALAVYYDISGQWAELLNTGQRNLEYSRLTGNLESIARITQFLGWVYSQQGRHAEAENAILEMLEAASQLEDLTWQWATWLLYSQVQRRRGAFEEAFKCCQQALEFTSRLKSEQQIYAKADVDYELGKLARDQEDWQAARAYFSSARDVFRHDETDPVFNLERAWGLVSNLGLVAHKLGELDKAAELYRQALGFFKETGGRGFMTTVLVRLAALEEQRGRQETAQTYAQEALEWVRRLDLVQERGQVEAILARLL